MKTAIALFLSLALLAQGQSFTPASRDGSNVTNAAQWKTNLSFLQAADVSGLYAPINNPSFTGTVTLPSTTAIGSVSSTELGYLDGVTSAIQTQIGTLSSSIGLKVDASSLSTTGGANKVLQMDASGNLYTGPLDNRSSGVYLASGFGSVGNIYIPDQQGLIWRDPANGAAIFNIRHWRGHDAILGEAIIESAWRIALLGQGPIQFGHNDVNPTSQVLHITSGGTSPSRLISHSRAISWQTKRYNGGGAGIEKTGYVTAQATSTTDNSDSTVFRIGIKDELTSSGTGPTTGFNGGGFSYDNGKSLASTVAEFSTARLSVPSLTMTAGNLVFADATELGSTSDIQDMIDASTAPRTGFVELVAGEATVVDASITGYTEILVSHKTADGTLGHLSTVKDYGVGFDIISSSATDTSTVSYLLVEGPVSDVPPPSISGTSEIGDTLTVSGGSGTRQWYANDVAISGQTGATYVIQPAYIGQAISCYVGGVESNTITAWHPDDETGYFADYRADAGLFQTVGGTAATAHGHVIGQWQDQSGNNRHLITLADSRRPTLDLTTYSGYPHARFDGSDDFMLFNVSISRPQTAYLVGESVDVVGNARLLNFASSGERLAITNQLSSEITNGITTTAATTGDLWPLNQRNIVMAQTTTAIHRIRVAGGTLFSSSANSPVAGDTISLGGNSVLSHNCRIYALLVYTAEHDSASEARVRKYLKAKWGTP